MLTHTPRNKDQRKIIVGTPFAPRARHPAASSHIPPLANTSSMTSSNICLFVCLLHQQNGAAESVWLWKKSLSFINLLLPFLFSSEMPLVMLCGFPCSGKSTAVAKLAAHLRSKTKFAVRCLCAYILKFYHFYGLCCEHVDLLLIYFASALLWLGCTQRHAGRDCVR